MPPSSTNQHGIAVDTWFTLDRLNYVMAFQRWILISLMCRTPYLFVFIFNPPSPHSLRVCFFFRATKRLHRHRAVTVTQVPFFSSSSSFSFRLWVPGVVRGVVVMDGNGERIISRVHCAVYSHTHTKGEEKRKEMAQTDRRSSARGSRL
jgi:hypothetical protein